MRIPSKLNKGDSAAWSDYSSSDNLGNEITSALYTLKYAIRGASSLDLTGTANASGGWDFVITPEQSALLTVGVLYWQAFAEKTGSRVTFGTGSIEILPDYSSVTAPTFDGSSQTSKDLKAVQAAMRAMISGGAVQEYTIGNRSMRKMDMETLVALESKLKFQLNIEEKDSKIAQGKGNPFNLKVRF